MPRSTTKQGSSNTAADLAAQRRAAHDAALAEAQSFDAYVARVPTVAQIRSSWARGEQRYSALDYLAAKVEHGERLPAIKAGVQRRLREAKSRLVPTEPALAEAATAILGGHYDLPAEVAVAEPSELSYDGGDGRLIVVQDRLHKTASAGIGSLTGHLAVLLVRDKRHRVLDASTVLDALEANGWRFPKHLSEVVSTDPCDGGEVDRFAFEVGMGFPSVPEIAQPSGFGVADAVADRIASDLNKRIRLGVHGNAAPGGTSAQIVSSETADDGTVTTVLTARVAITGNRPPEFGVLMEQIKFSLRAVLGLYTRAGKITEAELSGPAGPINAGDSNVYAGAGCTVRVTAVSKAEQ